MRLSFDPGHDFPLTSLSSPFTDCACFFDQALAEDTRILAPSTDFKSRRCSSRRSQVRLFNLHTWVLVMQCSDVDIHQMHERHDKFNCMLTSQDQGKRRLGLSGVRASGCCRGKTSVAGNPMSIHAHESDQFSAVCRICTSPHGQQRRDGMRAQSSRTVPSPSCPVPKCSTMVRLRLRA